MRFNKQILSLVLIMVILIGISPNIVFAENIVATPTCSKVFVNGTETLFDSYTINGNNYFKLRDFAVVVKYTKKQFDVSWDGDKKAINLVSNKSYSSVGEEMAKGDGKSKTAVINKAPIYKDGIETQLAAYTINSNNYFKLRDLAEVFDIGVDWDNVTKSIIIETNYFNDEIQMAINLGIVPKQMQSSYTKPVTEIEMYTLLSNCIYLKTGKIDTEWGTKILSADSKRVLNRQQTADLLYNAAKFLGESAENLYETDALYFRTDKLNQEFVEKNIKEFNPIFTDVIICDYMDVVQFLPEYSQYDFSLNGDKSVYSQEKSEAISYSVGKSDNISGKKLMDITENYCFRPKDDTTVEEAILAVYRLYNAIDDNPEYVTLENVGANTISSDIIARNSSLPDATNNKLPQWKGVGIANKGSAAKGSLYFTQDRNFHESEIKFISENGFNFARVSLAFSTLGYPDYPEDMVNEVELRELDRLIEWGMKYDVHINICMSGQPGFGDTSHISEIYTGDFFTNTRKQTMVKEYWQMLSKRYANIPNKNLSFNLMNEPEPPSDDVYTEVFKPIVESIWKECPNRVIISDCTGSSSEGLAKMGVALSYHFYSPNILCYNGMDYMKELYPYLDVPQWPMMYLPSCLSNKTDCDTVEIEGMFDDGSIGIQVIDVLENTDTVLTIFANNKIILQEKIIGKDNLDNDRNFVLKEYLANIPKGTTKLEIKAEGWFRYGRIQIKQNGKDDITMNPHDLHGNDQNVISPKIFIYDNGTYKNNNTPEQVVDWNYLYSSKIKKHVDMAEKYNVGFMIGEFGPFGQPLSKTSLLSYMDMVLNGLNSKGIAWSNGGFIQSGYIACFAPYSDAYTFLKLSDSDLYINEDLLSIYKKYLK